MCGWNIFTKIRTYATTSNLPEHMKKVGELQQNPYLLGDLEMDLKSSTAISTMSRRIPFSARSAMSSSNSLETDSVDRFLYEEAIKPSHPSHKASRQQLKMIAYDEGIYDLSKRAHLAFLNPHDKGEHKVFPSKQDLMKEFKKLTEIKDLLHFILSYPVKLHPDGFDYSKLQKSISMLDRWIEDLLVDGTLTSSSRHGLPIFLDGIYTPVRWILMLGDLKQENSSYYRTRCGPHVENIPSWAIKSAIRQATDCILGGKMKLIAISGQEAEQVAEAVKDIPQIQSKFNIVLNIRVSRRQKIEEVDECINEQLNQFIQTNTLSLSLQEVKMYSVLLILDCVGKHTIDHQILKTLMDREYACVVLSTQSDDIYGTIIVDQGIRMENHLLPLELFYDRSWLNHNRNFLDLKELALILLEQCHGDLFVVVLLAKELRRVRDVGVWKEAVEELKLRHSCPVDNSESELLIGVLTFIWKRKDEITKLCIQRFAAHSKREELTVTSMVSSLLADGLVQTQGEGEAMIHNLIRSTILKKMHPSVIMRGEIKDVLMKCVIPSLGLPLTARAIVDNADIINLKNSEVTELPDSPTCPHLVLLCLESNCDLMIIPPLFFSNMPLLSTLNLSYTSIKTLPASISALVSLRRLFIRDCDLFLELPPEIGQLSDLEVLDLEGTKVMYLPKEIAQLQKLRQLKLSFYACGEGCQSSKQRIPEGVISKLQSLEELWIGVNPDEDDDDWIADVENILYDDIRTDIMLYVPDTRLLDHLSYPCGKNYKLIVGRCGQRMISRIPSEVEDMSKQQGNYLKYVNGKCIPAKVKEILRYTGAFILDRHWTVKSLTEFGTEVMYKLRFCLLVECNQLQTILDEDDENFQYLKYLNISYMKNLRSICSGQVSERSLYCLQYLSLCTCTSLDSIFSTSLLSNLPCLEELLVEDCPKIESLVTQDGTWEDRDSDFLPSLKKMSLRELPDLVSISNGLKIAPKLEKLVIFYCPKLETISEELGGNLNVIKGETEWWDSLLWQETDRLAHIFVPLKRDGDLMAQFSED